MKISVGKSFGALAAAGMLFGASSAFAGGTSEVAVEMTNDGPDMALKVTPTEVPAGKVHFSGVNTSQDGTVHEMLVLAVDSTLPNLPYDDGEMRVPEDKIESLGEIPEVESGAKGELTLDLQPGYYLLFCNKPGHFDANMKVLFTVK